MHKLTVLLAAAVSLSLSLGASADTVVFRNANVVSMTSPKAAEKQTVVVKDDRIEALLAADAPAPEGATVIDASGKYLMPGLADMHAHLPPPNSPPRLLDDVLYLYLANGVTTIRTMFGHDGQLNLRDWQKKGDIVAPNLYVAGPGLTNTSVKSAEAAVAEVKAQKKAGWDLIKVLSGLTREEYDAIAKTAKAEGIRFGGHVPESVGLLHAMEMGQESFEHLDGYLEYLDGAKGPVNEKKLADVVKRSKAAGVWVVPTLTLWEIQYNAVPLDTLRAYPELKYVPARAAEVWAKMYTDRAETLTAEESKNVITNRARILAALYKGGVKILAGTDSPQQFDVPGYALHRELLAMKAAGMSTFDVLKSATVNAGEYFKKQDGFGTIEAGKRADLVLLAANPLEDLANVDRIDGVMVRGRWYSRTSLDERLAKAAGRYSPKPAE
jgi:imidazolonepropionase-like amidohydrolase